MRLPISWETFLGSFKTGRLLFFSNPQLNSIEKHHHIVINVDEDYCLVTVCTSKIDTVNALIKRRMYSQETFVYINPKKTGPPFTIDTYVNCNDVFLIKLTFLERLYKLGLLIGNSEISEIYLHQILYGITQSKVVSKQNKQIAAELLKEIFP